MAWPFNKKKTKVQPEPVSEAQKEEIQISKDMRNIDKASQTLDELNDTLSDMWTGNFRNSVLNAAQENQRKIENFNKLYEKVTSKMAETGDEMEIGAMKREKDVIEGAAIQYQNTKQEDAYQDGENRLYFVTDEAPLYQEVPGIMKEVLEEYTPSDVNRYQAADTLPELKYFLKQLQSALESGQKLKADICKIIFSYVMQVLLRIEPIGSEEKIQKDLELRKKTMTEQFAGIIDAVDKIYHLVNDLKSYETRVNHTRNEYRKLQKEKNEIPTETLNNINKMGFANLLKKYPGDASISYYQSLFHEMQTTAVWLKTTELYRDNCRDKLFSLEQQLSQMLYQVMQNFNTQGQNVSMDVLSNMLEQATQTTIAQIQRDDAALHAYFNSMLKLDSQITALRADITKANDAAIAAQRIAEYEKIEERRKIVNEQIAARRKELEAEAEAIKNEPQTVSNQENVHSNKILADMM